jgi:hypothetical protein
MKNADTTQGCPAFARMAKNDRRANSPTAARINDIRDIKPPMEIPNGWEWLWWTLGALAAFAVAALIVWRGAGGKNGGTQCSVPAADSRARPRETKIGRSARVDFAAQAVLHSGFGHDPVLSRRTV